MTDPKQLGPFTIKRSVGRGGMGAVYEAVHEETGTTVALKVLLDPVGEESELRSRFEVEIETLKRLRHPNIVRLFGFGQEENVLYYAMEFVQGPSLQDLLRKRRLFTWEEVVHIGIGVSQALRHAHDRGIIHRDIKPANILLLDDGQVKVSDYGIAHFFGGSRLTDANMVIGTIEYMAPEQANAGPLTPKSDIYSLGALLYALITGRPPYPARSLPEIMKKYKSGPPESVRYKRPEVPAVLDLFIMELLRLQPEKRPANARLIQRRLEAIRTAFAPDKDCLNPFLSTKRTAERASGGGCQENNMTAPPSELPPPAPPRSDTPLADRGNIAATSRFFSSSWQTTDPLPNSHFQAIRMPSSAGTDSKANDSRVDLEQPSIAVSPSPVGKGDVSGSLPPNLPATKASSAIEIEPVGTNSAIFETRLDPRSTSSEAVSFPNDDFDLVSPTAESGAGEKKDHFFPVDGVESAEKQTGPLSLMERSRSGEGSSFFPPWQGATRISSKESISREPNVENVSEETDFSLSHPLPVSEADPAKLADESTSGTAPKAVSASSGGGGIETVATDALANLAAASSTSDGRQAFSALSSVPKKGQLNEFDFAPNPSDDYVDGLAKTVVTDEHGTDRSNATSEEGGEPTEKMGEDGFCVSPSAPPVFQGTEKGNSAFRDTRSSSTAGNVPTSSTKTSHFTMVKEEELGRIRADEEESPRYVSAKVWGFSIILLMVGCLFWFSLRSPSSDWLFRKIETKLEGAETENEYYAALKSLEEDFDRFLTLYPNEPRADKVREYSYEMELGSLERRLERQIERKTRDSSLSASELAYIEAIQTVKNDPEQGVLKLQAFVELFSFVGRDSAEESGEGEAPAVEGGDSVASATGGTDEAKIESKDSSSETKPPAPVLGLRRGRLTGEEQTISGQCVLLAKRRLAIVQLEMKRYQKLQIETLEGRLDLADSLDSSDPERAKGIRRAIVCFYGQRQWASAIIERAKKGLGGETPESDSSADKKSPPATE